MPNDTAAQRQMVMVAFLQAQNCTNLPGSWRHPHSRTDTWSADYYQHIGRVLEEGKFHLGFDYLLRLFLDGYKPCP